jgi:hypothetical protein
MVFSGGTPNPTYVPPAIQPPSRNLVLIPYSPNKTYKPVSIGIAGIVPLTQVTGSGGWQIVDRPRRVSATQWYDRSPFELVIPGILDQSVTNSATSPSEDVAQMISWMDAPDVNATVIQPPTITVRGPILGTELTWVVYSLNIKDALRDKSTGEIIQQMVDITLYEYNPPFPSLQRKSPTQTASKLNKSSSTKNYVVKAGDTLAKIATQQMKGVALSTAESKIIDANRNDPALNMRSPNQILTSLLGKTIKIPSS